MTLTTKKRTRNWIGKIQDNKQYTIKMNVEKKPRKEDDWSFKHIKKNETKKQQTYTLRFRQFTLKFKPTKRHCNTR